MELMRGPNLAVIQSYLGREILQFARLMREILMNSLRTGLLTALIGTSQTAAAQTAPTKYKLDIPRQTLTTAIIDFARQTGLQVARFSNVSEPAVVASSVVGFYTAEEAL